MNQEKVVLEKSIQKLVAEKQESDAEPSESQGTRYQELGTVKR